jgi:Fe-S cluster assembly iron-binding protein IscA
MREEHCVLQLTSQAAAILSHTREKEGLPENFGVRIFAAPDPSTNSHQTQSSVYGFGFVERPRDGDAVGETDGTPYYVAPEVADSLDDVVLDVAESGNLVLTRSADTA